MNTFVATAVLICARRVSRMPKGYIDCFKCRWSHKLYDYTGKWTGAVFCSKRNGKIRKRFRGECKYKESE